MNPTLAMGAALPTLLGALSLGLVSSAHCIAMCGGVVSVVCSATTTSSSNSNCGGCSKRSRVPHWLAYNIGRIASYTLMGALFGALGTISTGIFPIHGVRLVLRALVVVTMFGVGLQLVGLPSMMRPLENVGARLWAKVSPWALRHLPLRNPWHALLLGGLWGLMPCGMLYGAFALAAATESLSAGAMTMGAFAVGTLPVILAMSALVDRVARALALTWVRKTAGVVVLLFGLWGSVGLVKQLMLSHPAHECCTHK
ncbi:MAG: sulfite exporter TauE/SafE family protein [Polyangiaceae bacterium]|nr:sulfite exporter TauE/SafE family protein [Polyangiaceae bacterium]